MRQFDLPGRSPAYATSGMAATSHPRATLAALEVLRDGGNAVDAAVTAVAVLSVVEPGMTGIAGDCFALYAPAGGGPNGETVIGYNGSGRAPAAATVDRLREQGVMKLEPTSVHTVTVPGAIEAWARLAGDFGTRDLGRLLAPAIELAEAGYPTQPRVAWDTFRFTDKLAGNEAARALFLVDGKAPPAGTLLCQPKLAATLRAVAEGGPAAFYEGPVAEAMVRSLNALGGLHTVDDFAARGGDYVAPVSTRYRDVEILECPPNGQGFVALILLNILEGFDLASLDPDGAERLHLEIEAARLAYADRDSYVFDHIPDRAGLDPFLSKEYAAGRRRLIDPDRAMAADAVISLRPESNTTYLCVVDVDGNAISLINSLFAAFGSGIACPETGVVFQNRGLGFSLDPASANAIGPRKRPVHTIMPGMMLRDGQVEMPFGVMGGQYQPYGHAHFLTNLVDYGMDPQAALDNARLFANAGNIEVESGITAAAIAGLEARGHTIVPAPAPHGGGQAIRIDRARGVLVGGSDPRKDGCAMGF
ncbi:MAG: gamma-glutamyltransferase [Alphaproteobacteria bacterium]